MAFHLKLLLVIFRTFNFLLSDFGYRMANVLFSLWYGLYRYGTTIYLFIYFFFFVLLLELITLKFIFNRKKYYEDGLEIISELKQEIKRRTREKN